MNSTSKTALQAIGTGLAGAAAATIAARTTRRTSPRSSLLGFLSGRGMGETMRQINFNQESGRRSHRSGIAGNLLSNSLLFGLAGARGDKRNWLRGAMLGLGAGLGAATIPRQKRSFWFTPARRTKKAKLLTFGRYLFGGLAAAAASRLIGRASNRRHSHNLFD